MPRPISFASAAPAPVQSPMAPDSQRYLRQQAMSDALLSSGRQQPQGWGDAIGKLAQQAAGVFAGNRAAAGEKAATQARLDAMRGILGSDDPLAALSQSNDPELVGMGLNAQMAKLLDPQSVDLKEVYDPENGAMVYVPEQEAIGRQASAPEQPKAPNTVGGMMWDAASGGYVPIPGYTEQAQAIAAAGRAPQQGRQPQIITLTAPDGKAVSLYDNDPQLPQMLASGYVEGRPAVAPAGKPGDLPESLKFYTDKTKPYIDAASETRMQGSLIQTALAQGNGTGDIAGITAFNKLLDPGAVVREADVTLTLQAQGLADQLAVWVQNKKEGDILPPLLREKMAAMSKQIVDTSLEFSKQRIAGFKPGAEKYGVDWTDILPPTVETQLFNPPPPPNSPVTPDPGFNAPGVIEWERGPDGRPRRKVTS